MDRAFDVVLRLWPKSRRRVVYKCLFGYSETFADSQFKRDGKTDFICFTDDRSLKSRLWRFKYLDPSDLGPVRTSKMVKLLPHLYVGQYASSLYLDNTVEPKVPAERFFSHLDAAASPMVCFRHPERDCVYDEAETVTQLRLDSAETVAAQMEHYRGLGHPRGAGLVTATIMLRRHNDRRLIEVNERWFSEVNRWSYRDQLSFNVVARQLGFEPEYLPGTPFDNELMAWPRVSGWRLPRGFRDEIYLRLNPDVQATGLHPRKHYIEIGAAEGRPWELQSPTDGRI